MKKGMILILLLIIGFSVIAEGKKDNDRGYYDNGMMGNNGSGMMGNNGYGMMGNYSDTPASGERLDMESVEELVVQYINSVSEYKLAIAEIMEFSQNFYVQIADEDSKYLFEELLVDPYSGAIYPEHGPNMMWNLSNSHMMGGYSNKNVKEMTVSQSEAVKNAASFLKSALPGTTSEDHGDVFNGYYTLHVLKDDNIVGMLSVNGYSGQVWYHNWHGEFLGMKEID